jgi:hypothetical protein
LDITCGASVSIAPPREMKHGNVTKSLVFERMEVLAGITIWNGAIAIAGKG